jgi:hypothetical protein
MTSTTNLIELQSDLKDNIKGEYKFWNARNGTCIMKEMADHSAMKSYLGKNNLHYFAFFPRYQKACQRSNLSPFLRQATHVEPFRIVLVT